MQREAVIEFGGGKHAAQRVFQLGNVANLLCHVLDAGGRRLETLQQSGRSSRCGDFML